MKQAYTRIKGSPHQPKNSTHEKISPLGILILQILQKNSKKSAISIGSSNSKASIAKQVLNCPNSPDVSRAGVSLDIDILENLGLVESIHSPKITRLRSTNKNYNITPDGIEELSRLKKNQAQPKQTAPINADEQPVPS